MRSKRSPLHRAPRRAARRRRCAMWLAGLACAAVILAGGLYTLAWFQNQARIERESAQYSGMYAPAQPGAPTPEPATAPPSTAQATPAPLPAVDDVPIPTPDDGTLVLALETPPPVQSSFAELLGFNSDTVGFLRIDDIVSLPVVQRKNDNEYYLSHAFSGVESAEGTLFLDGMNLLAPEDPCLIVYGHNMQNGTMFGDLKLYLDPAYFAACPPISFDTIYENRLYAPFAAFVASVDPADANYFDVRQFPLGSDAFNAMTAELRARSAIDSPIDVRWGDAMLLLVTCDSAADDGRLVVAFRALREDESAASIAALLSQAAKR